MKNIALASQFGSLLVIATFCGVMLCIYTSHLPFWKQVAPDDFLHWFSTYSGGISDATGPLGILSLILPVVTLAVTWSNSNSRIYWLLASLLMVGVIAITMIFFVKANTSFMNKTISVEAIPETLVTWGRLHFIRITMTSLAAILAVIGILKYQS
ncbi:MAG: DUF1772 domain-containing protein [Bacteroidota bacterium]